MALAFLAVTVLGGVGVFAYTIYQQVDTNLSKTYKNREENLLKNRAFGPFYTVDTGTDVQINGLEGDCIDFLLTVTTHKRNDDDVWSVIS